MNTDNKDDNNNAIEIRRERFVPATLDELETFVDIVARSGMTPPGHCDKEGRPNKASMKVAVMFGDTLGVGPMQSIQNISSVNNMPAVWGDLGLALVKSHPEFIDIIEMKEDDGWKCTIKRRGKQDVVRKFTIEDAKTSRLWEAKGISENRRQYSPWVKYPWRMLQWRSRWWSMRDAFPDALKGIRAAEEYIDVEVESSPVNEPVESPAEQLRRLKEKSDNGKKEEVKQNEENKEQSEEEFFYKRVNSYIDNLSRLEYKLSEPERKALSVAQNIDDLKRLVGYFAYRFDLEYIIAKMKSAGMVVSDKEQKRLDAIDTEEQIISAIEYFKEVIEKHEFDTGEVIPELELPL